MGRQGRGMVKMKDRQSGWLQLSIWLDSQRGARERGRGAAGAAAPDAGTGGAREDGWSLPQVVGCRYAPGGGGSWLHRSEDTAVPPSLLECVGEVLPFLQGHLDDGA